MAKNPAAGVRSTCSDGELLLVAKDRTYRAQNLPYQERGQSRRIERFYNAVNRHSTIGYLSPVEFERKARLA